MMLHLGGNDMIPLKHVVAILNVGTAAARKNAARGGYTHLPRDARSIIITNAHGGSGTRYSNISSHTLLHRQQGVKA